jgi:hypothetical protein
VGHSLASPHLKIDKNKKILSPEAKYQELKQQWYFHQSSWYNIKKGEGSYDGEGCNQFTGCIPECKFYLEKGKLAENEGFD